MSTIDPRDVWRPLHWLVTTGLVVFALALLTIPLAAVTSSSSFGIGDPTVCVTSKTLSNPGEQEDRVQPTLHFAAGAALAPQETTVCGIKRTTALKVLDPLNEGIGGALVLGFLIAAEVVMRRSERRGVFDRTVGTWVTRLGWGLFAGVILSTVGQWVTSGLTLERLVSEAHWTDGPVSIPWSGMIVALAVLCFGRLIRSGAVLQDEVDTTV